MKDLNDWMRGEIYAVKLRLAILNYLKNRDDADKMLLALAEGGFADMTDIDIELCKNILADFKLQGGETDVEAETFHESGRYSRHSFKWLLKG